MVKSDMRIEGIANVRCSNVGTVKSVLFEKMELSHLYRRETDRSWGTLTVGNAAMRVTSVDISAEPNWTLSQRVE